jgi:uncharacterized membrane protein
MRSRFIYSAPGTLIVLTLSFIILVSCTHEPVAFEGFDTVCYADQVSPILNNSCGISGCHNAASAEEGFVAGSYASVMTIVEPGEPRKSTLYKVITNVWGEHFMPPENPLSKEERNIIQLWIAQGAMDTDCQSNGEPPDTTYPDDTICFNQDILPIFLSGCATTACHDAASHAEGYVLTDYTHIINSEEGIVPYSPQGSEIYEKITTNESDERMPPPPMAPLTAKQISAIRTWIEEGALNSDCPDKACDTLQDISYSIQVVPILQNNCISCHNSTTASGGIMLNNYNNVKNTAETERNGTPLLIGTIRRKSQFHPMPPSYSLGECDIRIIELWIEQGILNN